MEVVMRRALPVISLLALSYFGTPLVAEEPRARKQPAGELIKQLGESNTDKVCAAARALGKRGPVKDAAPALKELLKHRNGRVRWSAAEALWRLEHQVANLVQVYAELLMAADADVRAASAWRLGRLGSLDRPSVLLLASALRDESFEVRVQAGQALANLGAFAEPALPALVRALGDKHLDELAHGDKRLEGVKTSPALPALLELADDAIPLLIETFRATPPSGVIQEGAPETRAWEAALRVTMAFPAFGGRGVAPLLQALESKEAHTRRYAVLALGEMAQLNGLPENAIDKLEKCLDDSDQRVRSDAASALS